MINAYIRGERKQTTFCVVYVPNYLYSIFCNIFNQIFQKNIIQNKIICYPWCFGFKTCVLFRTASTWFLLIFKVSNQMSVEQRIFLFVLDSLTSPSHSILSELKKKHTLFRHIYTNSFLCYIVSKCKLYLDKIWEGFWLICPNHFPFPQFDLPSPFTIFSKQN